MNDTSSTSSFVCQCCGACCRWPGIVRVHEQDVAAMARHLGMSEDDFREKYTQLAFDRQSLILTDRDDGACIFLTPENHCLVHPDKPEQCRGFPHRWDVPPELQQLCQGRQQMPHTTGIYFGLPFIHVLGHPQLPLDCAAHPTDAQVLNCHNFCVLLEHLRIPYIYYGISGSKLPGPGGKFADLGSPLSSWSYRNRWHDVYNRRLSRHLDKYLHHDGQPELIASLYGAAQSDIDSQDYPVLEPMVGYDHCWAPYRVFPSYAQQHVIYATMKEETKTTRFFDTVIPHFLEAEKFALADQTQDYLVYLGRNAADKGIEVARYCAEEAELPLVMIFADCHGDDKVRLLSQARAVLMPTLYVEPFGYVAIEAQMCGTPVITTDWGAFAETVIDGVNGFRCRTAAEFALAVKNAPGLNRNAIRLEAIKNYSVEAVAKQYADYFQFIWNVHHHGGFYAAQAVRKRVDGC